jgi:hypothetical protein
VLLIVMHESGIWRVRPGQKLTFGRGLSCDVKLPADDRGLSRTAGSFGFRDGLWWVRNDSSSSLLYLYADRGFRADLPPGTSLPIQDWHAKVLIPGAFADYALRLRLPGLDDADDADPADAAGGQCGPAEADGAAERLLTATKRRAPLTVTDRLVLAARFEEYLRWQHAGVPAPKSASETASRIGWQPHTVVKRCENIRSRYSRLGVPGLRGQRALEDLAMLLISTGELTADDLRLLPPQGDLS